MEKCKAKKPVEDCEGWIKVGKGKGKAPEVHNGGQISEIPSTSREAAKVGVEAPVEKESTENLGEEAAKEVIEVLVEEENQTAGHRQAATPLDSEDEDLQLEVGVNVQLFEDDVCCTRAKDEIGCGLKEWML
ncbi:hypothetical protein U1Q18_009874 [Sarracenia purpurea var. burkii]